MSKLEGIILCLIFGGAGSVLFPLFIQPVVRHPERFEWVMLGGFLALGAAFVLIILMAIRRPN
jgi:hypothetical protein